MTKQQARSAGIILLDGNSPDHSAFIRGWFRKRGFSIFETSCIIQALSAASDFAEQSPPDVILLEVIAIDEDFRLVSTLSEMLCIEEQIAVIALPSSLRNEFPVRVESDLAMIERRLFELFPAGNEIERTVVV